MLAHFGNCGMRTTLADNLNLTGTARHNMTIRHKISLTDEKTSRVLRAKIPAAFEGVVSFFNHTELQHINTIALEAGITQQNLPFRNLESLPKDNGERFFSEYLTRMREIKPKFNDKDRCMCTSCDNGNIHNNPTTTERSDRLAPPTTTKNTELTVQMRPMAQPNEPTHTQLANQLANTQDSANNNTESTAATHRAGAQLPQCNSLVRGQDQQQQHTNQFVTPHLPNHQQYWPTFAPAFQQPMTPLWTYPAMAFAATTQTVFCGGPHRQWCNSEGRRGRPPHDCHCRRVRVVSTK